MRPFVPSMLSLTLLLLPPAPRAAAGSEAEDRAAEAEEAAKARDFAGAAVKMEAARAAATGQAAAEYEGRREELALARDGLASLVAAIGKNPERFTKVPLARDVTAAVKSADARGIAAALPGGATEIRWSAMDRKLLVVLADRAAVPAPDALPLAALLHEVGAKREAETLLLAHFEAGGEPLRASRIYARWNREEMPEGGYVLHDGALVTREDRDRMSGEDRMAGLYRALLGDDGAAARRAFDELRGFGEASRWTLYKGLRARRTAAAVRVAELKVVRSAASRQRLKVELESRRKAALSLIEDPEKYPYPSETHAGQKEVDALVDRVRAVWSRPLEVVAEWDPSVGTALAAVAEVDRWIAEVEEGYEPDAVAARAPAEAILDVPGLFPDEYSDRVLAYNLAVQTTSDPEERDNVLAVNEYRRMMGRQAVRIHERLLRAARGHSRHMAGNGYFSHNNDFPGLETPGKRAARQGYTGGVGENISAGRPTGRGAFDAWFHSSGHHRNMIGAGWTELGAGRYGSHFTQLFGRAGGRSLTEPDPLLPPTPDVAPDNGESGTETGVPR